MQRAEASICGVRWQALLFIGLSLSIGWGIRGNFGHEWGAAMPGALAAMAAALLSQRADWQRRIPYFGFFGAVGWALGGSMSYMIVIAYTHSGDSATVLYGFACLFVIGFLWGAAGGAATALPAYLTRERLAEFFAPLTAFFVLGWADGIIEDRLVAAHPEMDNRPPLNWFDTNWTAALIFILVVLLRAAFRRKIDQAERLILHMAVGWWLGFLILTIGLRLHMTPPRSDNWAGSIGMIIGMFVYFHRQKLYGVIYAGLIMGFVGGLGFATAALFKLMEMRSGYATNWHSILEQTYGLINGLGIAIMMERLRPRAQIMNDDGTKVRWSLAAAVAFILLLLTYMNLQHEVDDWTRTKAVPQILYFLTARGWFDLFYALTAGTFLLILREHMRRPLALVPASWIGKGQMLYLMFLWWIVIANFVKAVVGFAPQRLVTEGTIHINALLCTLMALLWVRQSDFKPGDTENPYEPAIRRTLQLGLAVMALAVLLNWGAVRAVYGNQFAGSADKWIRFGPHATRRKSPSPP
jgi:hypothetical protein